MPITPDSPCHERWSDLKPDNDGRYCLKCDKTVVDLTSLTRRQAEKAVRRAGGSLCGRLRIDGSGAPVFRRETERTPGFLGIAAAGLLAACGSSTAEESTATTSVAASMEASTEATTGGDHLLGDDAPSFGSLGMPMMPLADDRDLAEAETTGTIDPVSIAGVLLTTEGDDAVPTADQLLLTERKEEDRHPTERTYGHGPGRRTHRVGTHADPGTTTTGHRTNGGHASTVTTPPASLNNPPPAMYLGGISYTP